LPSWFLVILSTYKTSMGGFIGVEWD
jgi:hypothetical protein